LALGEAAPLEEAIEGGGGESGGALAGGQSQFTQQRGSGAMGIFAFETFDEIGQLRRDGARLPAVLARLGGQGFKAPGAVAQCPVQQGIDGDRSALRAGDLVMAGGDLQGAPGEFAPWQRFQHQGRDQAVAE